MSSDFFRADLEERPDHPSLVLFLLIRINRYKLELTQGFPIFPYNIYTTDIRNSDEKRSIKEIPVKYNPVVKNDQRSVWLFTGVVG